MLNKNSLLAMLVLVISACGAPNSIPAPAIASPTPAINLPAITVTMNPSEEATPQSVATAEGDEDYGDVNCTHPFYPVADGATWMYAISDGGNAIHTMSVDAFGDFTIKVEGAEMTAAIEGQCAPDGIVIMEAPGATTTVTDENGTSTVSTLNVSGVTVPNDISQGQQWTQTITVTTDAGASVIETNYTAVGFENVTVPAGEFYVLKVEQSGYVTVFGQKVDMHGFTWYAEGVGVVKSAWDGAPTVELMMYDIPD